MKKVLLALETMVSVPFFLLSWVLCSIVVAIGFGYTMARSSREEKLVVLDYMLGKEKEKDKQP